MTQFQYKSQSDHSCRSSESLLGSLGPLFESLLSNQVVGICHDLLLGSSLHKRPRHHDVLCHLPGPSHLGDRDIEFYHLLGSHHSVSDLSTQNAAKDFSGLTLLSQLIQCSSAGHEPGRGSAARGQPCTVPYARSSRSRRLEPSTALCPRQRAWETWR